MTGNLVKRVALGCKGEAAQRALVVTMEQTTYSTVLMVEATVEMEGRAEAAVRVPAEAPVALEAGSFCVARQLSSDCK